MGTTFGPAGHGIGHVRGGWQRHRPPAGRGAGCAVHRPADQRRHVGRGGRGERPRCAVRPRRASTEGLHEDEQAPRPAGRFLQLLRPGGQRRRHDGAGRRSSTTTRPSAGGPRRAARGGRRRAGGRARPGRRGGAGRPAPGLSRPPRRAGRAPGGLGGVHRAARLEAAKRRQSEADRARTLFVKRLYRADPADPRALPPGDRPDRARRRRHRSRSSSSAPGVLRRQLRGQSPRPAAGRGAGRLLARRSPPGLLGASSTRLAAPLGRRLPLALDLPADRPAGGHRRRRRPVGRACSGSTDRARLLGLLLYAFPEFRAVYLPPPAGRATRPGHSWPGWPAQSGRASPAWT